MPVKEIVLVVLIATIGNIVASMVVWDSRYRASTIQEMIDED